MVKAFYLCSLRERAGKSFLSIGFIQKLQKEGKKFAYFKPSSGMNPEHIILYNENKFTVVRQLKYSIKNENSLDMVIFLNGIPIITMEL